MILFEILVPLLNVNEPEARVAQIHIKEGENVKKGTVLFTLETTKATSEIESPGEGVMRILVREGEILSTGAKLGLVTETSNEPIQTEVVDRTDRSRSPGDNPRDSIRITKPAKELAETLGVDLTKINTDQLITVDMIRRMASRGTQVELESPVIGREPILIFGGGGHAKTVIELIARLDKYFIAGILDDNPLLTGKTVMAIRVLGTRDLLPYITGQGVKLAVNCVGGILDIHVRVRVFELLDRSGYTLPALVHPRATTESSAKLGKGIQVFSNAYIGSEAELGDYCMVNTGAVVSHDCRIGTYSHVAPGALLAGNVSVGEKTLIGMGVTTAVGVKIGSRVRIGNSANILADVPDNTIVQAGRFWVGKA